MEGGLEPGLRPGDDVTARRSGILANTAYRAVADLGSKVASIALWVVMARELGASDFGVFSFAVAYVTLATALGNFGQDEILIREVARDRSRLTEYFGNTLALKAVLSLPVLGLAVGGVALASRDETTVLVVALLGLATTLDLFGRTCSAVFQASERLVFIPIALITQRFVTAVAGVTALLLGAGVVAVSALVLVGSAVGLVLSLVLMYRHVARAPLDVEVSRWKPVMWAAAPLGLADLFGTVLFRVDMFMLAWFASDAVVGNYGAAYRVFEATLFIGWSIGAAVYPVMSRLTPGGDPPLQPVVDSALKLALALSVPAALVAGLAAEPIVDLLFGSGYGDAPGALAILAPAIVFYPLSYVGWNLLVAQNRQASVTVILGAVAVANIAANLVLIPWLSLDGAALSTTLSQLALVLGYAWAARGLAGGVEWRRLTGPLVAAAPAAVPLALWPDQLAAIPVGVALYAVALFLFERAFYPADLRVLRPRR